MNMLIAACLAGFVLLTFALLLIRSVWASSISAGVAAVLAIVLVQWAAATPLPGPPRAPFVLWAASQGFSWVSPDRDDSPRTYAWQPPAEMLRDLRNGGSPLMVEGVEVPGQKALANGQATTDGGNEIAGGAAEPIYRWTPLQPENAQKD
jgi:hypothetical protein